LKTQHGIHKDPCEYFEPNQVIDSLRFVNCSFASVTVSVTRDEQPPSKRPIIRDVHLENCRCKPGIVSVGGAVIEDCSVDGFDGELRILSCCLSRVRLAGHVASVRIDAAGPPPGYASIWDDYRRANDAFYAEGAPGVALDVSELHVIEDCTIRTIPPALVKIDSSRQAFMSKASVAPGSAALGKMPLPGTVGSMIELALSGYADDDIFTYVTEGSKTASDELDLIAYLHANGLAVETAP
jgi:hypothetical protein